MSNFGKTWPFEQDKILLDNPGLSNRELVPLVNRVGPARSVPAINNRRQRLGSASNRAGGRLWQAAEVAILKRMAGTSSDVAIFSALQAAGYKRSIEAVRRARSKYGLSRAPISTAPKGEGGWPVMRGTDEERDRKFVRLLLEEQLRMVREAKRAAA